MFGDWENLIIIILLAVVIVYIQWRQQVSLDRIERRNTKAVEAIDLARAETARQLASTGSTLVDQLEKRLEILDQDYRKVVGELAKASNLYAQATEELSNLSIRQSSLRDEVTKLRNTIIAKDLEIHDLRVFLDWSLRRLRELGKANEIETFLNSGTLAERNVWIIRNNETKGEGQ